MHEARAKDGDDPLERQDRIVVKALEASPGRPFLGLLQVG